MELYSEHARIAIEYKKNPNVVPEKFISFFIETYREFHKYTVDVIKKANESRIEYVKKLIDLFNTTHEFLVSQMNYELELASSRKKPTQFGNVLKKSHIFEEIIAFEPKANASEVVGIKEKLRDGETVTNSIKLLIKSWIKRRWLGPLLEVIDEIFSLLRPF